MTHAGEYVNKTEVAVDNTAFRHRMCNLLGWVCVRQAMLRKH